MSSIGRVRLLTRRAQKINLFLFLLYMPLFSVLISTTDISWNSEIGFQNGVITIITDSYNVKISHTAVGGFLINGTATFFVVTGVCLCIQHL